jgi:2'-5' RNA ligase
MRIRTFIAVPLADAIREKALALQESMATASNAVKWVEPENIHLTLLFLGEVDSRELHAICRAVESVTVQHAPIEMSVAGTGCFPNPRRPRILWIGIDEGAAELVALHDDLEEALLQLGSYRREERDFKPHITLGRVKGEDTGTDLAETLVKYKSWTGGHMTAREVLVMGSELTRDGPVYTIIGRGKLRGNARSASKP